MAAPYELQAEGICECRYFLFFPFPQQPCETLKKTDARGQGNFMGSMAKETMSSRSHADYLACHLGQCTFLWQLKVFNLKMAVGFSSREEDWGHLFASCTTCGLSFGFTSVAGISPQCDQRCEPSWLLTQTMV